MPEHFLPSRKVLLGLLALQRCTELFFLFLGPLFTVKSYNYILALFFVFDIIFVFAVLFIQVASALLHESGGK